MEIQKGSVLLVIDIQQEDFVGLEQVSLDDPAWTCIRNARRVLDGSEGIHCMENSLYTDYAKLTYPLEGEYRITKRRYSAFFGTDLEILLKGLHATTLYLIGGLTDVCIHYTAVDAHQHDYYFRVVTDAVAGSSQEAHQYALKAMKYLQRDALITTKDVESAC